MVRFPNDQIGNPKLKGTALRQRFIDHLTLTGRARRTVEIYVRWVGRLAERYGTAPDRLCEKQIREFLLELHRNLTTTLRYLHLVEDTVPDHYDPRVSPLQSLESQR